VVAATGHSLKLDLDEDFGIDETLIAASLKETHPTPPRAREAAEDCKKLAGLAFPASGS
jgi:hypothetical protein